MTWQNRIIASGVEDPERLLANPLNWRIHPKAQQEALLGVLEEIGWVQEIVVNKRTRHLVDGHLRVMLAMRNDETEIPVKYIDVTLEEEQLILATLDPVAAMAAADAGNLEILLEGIRTDSPAIQKMLENIAINAGFLAPVDYDEEWQGMPEFQQDDLAPHRTIKVHFEDDAAVADFGRQIGQKVTEKTRYIWHPKQIRADLKSVSCQDDS